MDLRRLKFLRELDRLGSMRAVAEELGYTTSTVSQQLAVLGREAGVTLVERDGRRVRMTPAGRRLAEHAVTILAAVEAARLDLDPAAAPAGTVRVAGFATAVRRLLAPVAAGLAREGSDVRLRVHEHEPAEAFALLAADELDLALMYDYDLAPLAFDAALRVTSLWTTAWSLGVPATHVPAEGDDDAPAVFARFRDADWIVNSRNSADEQVVRTIASIAGFKAQITHSADSLELVGEMIVGGLGIGLLPAEASATAGVRLLALRRPGVTLRAFLVVRRGREAWAPLALVADLVAARAGLLADST